MYSLAIFITELHFKYDMFWQCIDPTHLDISMQGEKMYANE